MLINSIKNYSDDYGYARASATQESNWRIAGDLADTIIPILMSVLKGLVYSSFIFMFPMLIMSGGWGRYLKYLTLVASFQLWAPLNAVLNMFIDIYSSSKLFGIADQIVSFSTMSRIGNYTDKIVAVASSLQMAIPFLAFSIIQGGVGGFIHLAGTITGASQSAAGASSYQHMDGTMEKVTGGGNTLMQSGIGFTASGGATAYKQEDSRHAQVSEGMQVAESMHQQDLRSISSAQSKHLAKSADYIAHKENITARVLHMRKWVSKASHSVKQSIMLNSCMIPKDTDGNKQLIVLQRYTLQQDLVSVDLAAVLVLKQVYLQKIIAINLLEEVRRSVETIVLNKIKVIVSN
ncbi:Conjugal transfer TraD family protein N-terminal domain protein (plasmid) [Candidatus Trichorickettsia mobilis]|nr:Conjugal transfer TraD family protein N-terminal domain protein [Candidatus Trichorickettsia mobilis]